MFSINTMDDPQLGSVPAPLRGELGRVAPRLLGASRFTMAYREQKPVNAFRSRRWILELIVKGQIEIQFGKAEPQMFFAGHGFVIKPGVQIIEKLDPDMDPCQSVTVFFDLPPRRIYQPWHKLEEGYHLVLDPQGIGRHLIAQLITHLGMPGAAELMAQGCFYQIMAYLLHASQEHEGPWTISNAQPLEGDDMVDKAQRFMRHNLGQPIGVADVAAYVGLSVSGFAHRYRREAGESPMVVLRRLRIETAKMHLMRNRLSIEEIADQTGFSDAFHLSRTFKHFVGISPSQFRRLSGIDQ